MSEFKNLTLDVADGIAVLAISRPAALNALNSETLDELNVCLGEIEKNDDIKVVILTGGPDKKGNEFKSFVAGADIAEMVNFTAAEARKFGMKASVPFFKLMNQGMILGSNGEKMSKSKGNVINPDEIIQTHGADALRMYEMFMGPLGATLP